jgi:hypothetical protein
MRPQIKKTKFGMIKIEDEVYEHDVIIRLNGAVKYLRQSRRLDNVNRSKRF